MKLWYGNIFNRVCLLTGGSPMWPLPMMSLVTSPYRDPLHSLVIDGQLHESVYFLLQGHTNKDHAVSSCILLFQWRRTVRGGWHESVYCTVSGPHCLFMYFTVSVTDGLYEVVDMSLCILYCIRDTLLTHVFYCFSDGRTVRGGWHESVWELWDRCHVLLWFLKWQTPSLRMSAALLP